MKTEARDLFTRALFLAPEACEAFLQEACGDNAELRLEVQRMLVDSGKADSFFANDKDATLVAGSIVDAAYTEAEGDQIGPYTLRQKIGEGGFGTVWMAEQTKPITRMVALKVVKAGMDTKQVLARFGAERQAVAMMDHPNIAKVLDAGATTSGRPYFAMELVKGIPITQFCDDQKFGSRRRLELFKDVCAAVNHAHQKGIIHRDLKPSNIMVTLEADRPVVKVIDFGIAKATQGKLTENTLFTRFEQFLGTPVYMSPEQAAMSNLDVDTRSDIYSLGVLLYELLAGTPPFDSNSLLSNGYDEMRRIIREEDPPKPSTRLTQTQIAATSSGKKLHVNPTSLKGELDWIIMKAIEKDRARRYETANSFAMDIQRYLDDEPVSAAAPSVLYKCRKFARRNKIAFGAASAIVAALVLGLGIATLSYSRERAARADAEEQRREATEARDVATRKSEEATKAQQTAQSQTQVALSLRDAYHKQVYQSDMNLASVAHDSGNIPALRHLLEKHWPEPADPHDLRGFEWYHWWQATHAQVETEPPLWPLSSLDISPDYRLFALNRMDLGVVVRSTAAKKSPIKLGRQASCLAFSPDGTQLVLGGALLSVFDAETWEQQDPEASDLGAIDCLAFSSGQPLMASGSKEAGIIVWNTETWEREGEPMHLEGAVNSLAFTRDGSKLIAAMDDSTVTVWDLTTRTLAQTLTGHGKSVRRVVHSPVADLFVTGSDDETVRLWNGDFELIHTSDTFAPVTTVRFSPDGQKIVAGTSENNSVLVWNVEQQVPSLDLVQVIKGHAQRITGVAFLDDEHTIMSVSYSGERKTWDLAKCEPSIPFGKIEGAYDVERGHFVRLAYSKDGKEVWITGPSGERTGVNLDSRDSVVSKDTEGFHTLAVTNDEAWEAGAAEDGHLAVRNARRGVLRAKHPTLADPASYVSVFSAGPAVVWSTDTGVHIWNVAEDTTRTIGKEVTHPSLALPSLSPNGDRVAVHVWAYTTVWDLTVDPPGSVWTNSSWGPLFCSAFSPDGKLLATASADNEIRLHDAETGEAVRTLSGHTRSVITMQFSRDGSWLVSGAPDRTIRIWDVATGQQLSLFFNPDGPVAALAISPAEDSIASLASTGELRLWTTASPEEVNQDTESWVQRAAALGRQQHWDRALALLDEGMSHIPDSPELLLARSTALEKSGDLAAAVIAINQAIALAPMDASLPTQLARLQILTGELSDAAQSYHRIIELTPENELTPESAIEWMKAATLLISAGETEEYHQLCRDMLERFRDHGEEEVAERVAKSCLIHPPLESNLPAAVEQARKSVSDSDHWVVPYGRAVNGLADYRSGDFQGAREWARQALEDPPSWYVEAQAWLVLAMSEMQLGQTQDARTAMDRAAEILDANAQDYTEGRLDFQWHDWLLSKALQQEAEAVLAAGKP